MKVKGALNSNMERESEINMMRENERLEKLKEGDIVVTPGGDITSIKIPEWYNEKLFRKAKDVYKEYFASVNFSHLCGLLLSFYFTKNIKTLKSTGESQSKFNLFHRYLMTIRHIQKWYEGDVWNPKDPAHKSLSTVRSMHARVANKMAALNDGVVYVSQWDMALTQWAFIGPMVLFRAKVGLHSCTEEQYKSLIHFWRVIGYLLGIEDQYNLCTGNYDQVVTACKTLLENEYRQKVAAADPSSVSMAKNVVTSLNMIDPLITWPIFVNYIHELVDVPCPIPMSFTDWIRASLMRFVMVYVFQFPLARAILNEILQFRLKMADHQDLKFKEMKKYSIPVRTKVV